MMLIITRHDGKYCLTVVGEGVGNTVGMVVGDGLGACRGETENTQIK